MHSYGVLVTPRCLLPAERYYRETFVRSCYAPLGLYSFARFTPPAYAGGYRNCVLSGRLPRHVRSANILSLTGQFPIPYSLRPAVTTLRSVPAAVGLAPPAWAVMRSPFRAKTPASDLRPAVVKELHFIYSHLSYIYVCSW